MLYYYQDKCTFLVSNCLAACHLYRLYRSYHGCTTIAVQALQEWRNSDKRQVENSHLGGGGKNSNGAVGTLGEG